VIGATISNTANPTMLSAGYKHNVIPSKATACIDGRFVPGGEGEFYATINELIGDKVRYEVVNHQPSVETEFSWKDCRGECRRRWLLRIRVPERCHSSPPAGTDGKAWHRAGIRCFGFTPLRLPPELDFMSMFHGVDERVPLIRLQFGARVLDRFLDHA
jgi:acetylornithine deacetylase/succinyl-diaminopimelate desuccinylase-like protein